MSADKNKKQSREKILYIAFSIVMSIALWIYVAYVQNPEKPVTFNGIAVNFTGGEVLLENNLILTDTDTTQLSLTLSGKRNTITKLDGSDITATVNLAEIVEKYSATAGVYQLKYTLDYGGKVMQNAVSVSNNSKNYVSVTVEKVVTIPVPVTLRNNVKVADGYETVEGEISRSYIDVTGPQSVVSTITNAVVEVTREDVSKSIAEEVPVTLVNKDGEPVISDFITTNVDTVSVSIPVLLLKDVPLAVEFIDAVAVKGSDVDCTISPKTVRLSGDPEVLGKLDKIVIGTIDLGDFATDVTKKFDIVIPGDFNDLSGETTAKVVVKAENVTTRKYSVTTIQMKGTPIGRTAEAKTVSVDVTLRGTKEILDSITADNIRVVADLSVYSSGYAGRSFPAEVMFDDNYKVDVIGEYKVDVSVE